MFNNVGWGEVFAIALFILIVVGPERLPGVMRDMKAALITARNAINNTKQQLSEDIGSEFDDIARPVQQISRITAMGPKAALTQALFDGDGSYLDAFDPKRIMSADTQGEAYRRGAPVPSQTPHTEDPSHRLPQPPAVGAAGTPPAQGATQPQTSYNADGQLQQGQQGQRGGLSWDDIT